jgi:three-Cys-motif partner protein
MTKDGDLATALFGALPRFPAPAKGSKPPRHPVWTEHKAKLIATYLRLFTYITKHGAYIDGFAGPQNPADPDSWSARLALGNQPPWLRQFMLNDLDPAKVDALRGLKAAQPKIKGRSIEVFEGDFNANWRRMLDLAGVTDSVATFCVLDQRTFQCRWSTLNGLARFKSSGNKIELFYFLPAAWWDRAAAETNDKTTIDNWWGGSGWTDFQAARGLARGIMFSERLRTELGYADVRPYEIRSSEFGGRVMYYMIHATDHPVAPDLMARAYRIATKPADKAEQLTLKLLDSMAGALPPATAV